MGDQGDRPRAAPATADGRRPLRRPDGDDPCGPPGILRGWWADGYRRASWGLRRAGGVDDPPSVRARHRLRRQLRPSAGCAPSGRRSAWFVGEAGGTAVVPHDGLLRHAGPQVPRATSLDTAVRRSIELDSRKSSERVDLEAKVHLPWPHQAQALKLGAL